MDGVSFVNQKVERARPYLHTNLGIFVSALAHSWRHGIFVGGLRAPEIHMLRVHYEEGYMFR
jgi:hypothetical protein